MVKMVIDAQRKNKVVPMKRFAFTLMELVFVIIIIGILAVLAMPNFRTNPLQQATEQLASHIRYTQHLAMVDDRFDPTNSQWYSQMWVLWVRQVGDVNNGGENEWFYEIFSDRSNDGNSAIAEEAIDPLTGDTLGNGGTNAIDNTVDDNKTINLTRKYGISNIIFAGGANLNNSALRRVSFDHLGRPHRDADPNANANWRRFLITSDMNITLIHPTDGNATITIRPETGYVSVSYN
jgi:prepilin-type N-terminal cleavage/methylation domain-containing protein